MIFFDLMFSNIDTKLISSDKILETIDLSPRKICFSSCHPNTLKRKVYKGAIGTFSIPFSDTIKPIFESETNLKLFYSSKFKNYWLSIFSEDDFATIDKFIKEYSEIVFIRDCLDLSIALSENFIDDERTELGLLEYEAKYSENGESVKKIISKCSEWINKLPFYKNADYICAVPPSKKDTDNLPRKVARELKDFAFEDISNSVSWSNDKEGLKGVECSKKLELLESTGLDINIDLKGKVVILLDDLYQSGITMQYVAMKMKEAGAARIFGLSIVKSRSNTDNV